jgi:hypothetical protein
MTIDPTCLLKGLEDAKANPERFNMAEYCVTDSGQYKVTTPAINLVRHHCATVMCLAGWASAYITSNPGAKVYWDVIDEMMGNNHNAGVWDDLDKILHGCSAWYPEDTELQNLTIEDVEAAVHQFIKKYNGVPAQ